ncbi:DUF2165 family protein [Pandoraea aquatica]|nr:DUF2165 family protein [Pandoraea aquatica]
MRSYPLAYFPMLVFAKTCDPKPQEPLSMPGAASVLDAFDAFVIFKLVLVTGLTLWSAIAALNNVVAFGASSWAIGRTLNMSPLREAPAIEIPLLRRALHAKGWSVLALLVLIALQLAATLCLGWGGIQLAGAIGVGAAHATHTAIAWATLGLSALSAAWLMMMIGGLWFGYWIRQEGLQLTHMMLLTLTIAAAAVLRM